MFLDTNYLLMYLFFYVHITSFRCSCLLILSYTLGDFYTCTYVSLWASFGLGGSPLVKSIFCTNMRPWAQISGSHIKTLAACICSQDSSPGLAAASFGPGSDGDPVSREQIVEQEIKATFFSGLIHLNTYHYCLTQKQGGERPLIDFFLQIQTSLSSLSGRNFVSQAYSITAPPKTMQFSFWQVFSQFSVLSIPWTHI